MDKSTFRHRVSVAPWDEWNFHAFVRSDDRTVEHYWPGDEGVMFGPEDLGGEFDTDPVAVWHFSEAGMELHLIGRSGSQLVDWMWLHPQQAPLPLLGQPTVVSLPGLAAADPEVIGTAGRVDVFAPGLEGPMRHWSLAQTGQGWRGPEVLTTDPAEITVRPRAVHGAGGFHVFSIDTDNAGLRHWFDDENGWRSERLTSGVAGQGLRGQPVAVAATDSRLDVFATRNDGVPIHWGWDGVSWRFQDEVRLGSPGVLLDDELALISVAEKQMTFVARVAGSTGPHLVTWELDPRPPGTWRGPRDVAASAFPVSTWSSGTGDPQPDDFGVVVLGQMSMLLRSADGSFTHTISTLTNANSIDGLPTWQSEDFTLFRTEPPPPPATFTPAVVEPELLARRPDDLVLMGVRWNDTVEVLEGPPGELVAHAGAELSITLPPQHTAESVVGAAGPVSPDIDTQLTGDVPVWASSASGPSRVVVTLDEGTRVPLTVAGVLDALRRGHLAPATDLTDPHTQIELPFRMLMTPFRADGGAIGLDHPSTAVPGPGGAIGLWNARIGAAGSAPAAPAGLTLRPLGVDSEDPFRTSLSGASRARILVEEATARIDRLRLSALGGTLTASGSWPTFEWDHVATLGRDQLVRTAMQGVLYPYGHRAVYVEVSERHLGTTAEGSIAHLRKRSVLTVTEPVKAHEPSRAFPFTEVRIERTLVEFASDPEFETKEFPSPATDELELSRSLLLDRAHDLRVTIDQGDMGPAPGAPPVEDLALGGDGVLPEVASAASSYVDLLVAVRRIDDQLAALAVGGTADVPVFVVPRDERGPLRFPVLLRARSGEQVAVDLPLVFVADIRMREGLLHPAYSSLTDPDVLQGVADAYRAVGDGEVAVSPVRLDVVGATETKPADTPEVRRLHIVGEPRDGSFGPRLGIPPAAGETVPPPDRWAFEMAMTELGTLAGHQGAATPTLRVALGPELLSGSPDPGLLFLAPQGTAALTAMFSQNSARSGGLAAPDLEIDGISRSQGPVQAASFLENVAGGDLDPKKFLGEAATLLGFHLADLIDGSAIEGAPQILSDPTPGRPPTVTMTWAEVPLRSEGSFIAAADATLDIEVMLSPEHQRVRCTVRHVALAFPTAGADKLLEVRFTKVEMVQEGGGSPVIDVDLAGCEFFGFLRLLQELQSAVKLGGGTPGLQASDRGVTATYDLPVPDVTAVGFQLTGLTFHGVIDVPFDERPVTIGLAFASREDPFNVSVLALGGGGYVDIVLDKTGLRRLEISLEFGASLEIDFVVATGEVYAMGGIRVVEDDGFSLAAYVRFGGMVEVLGLVSVSVELLVTLTYKSERNALVGQATLVLELDLLLFSESVELDSGEWVIAGDDSPVSRQVVAPQDLEQEDVVPLLDPGLEAVRIARRIVSLDPDAWRSYRAAFDEEAFA